MTDHVSKSRVDRAWHPHGQSGGGAAVEAAVDAAVEAAAGGPRRLGLGPAEGWVARLRLLLANALADHNDIAFLASLALAVGLAECTVGNSALRGGGEGGCTTDRCG